MPQLQAYWQDHLDTSKASIQQASQRAGTNKAILFGVGNCSDIPLVYLADRFDHLTAVYIEPQGITKAVEAIPGSLQAKIDVQIEDLTGITAETFETMTLLLSQAKNPIDFIEKVLANLPI